MRTGCALPIISKRFLKSQHKKNNELKIIFHLFRPLEDEQCNASSRTPSSPLPDSATSNQNASKLWGHTYIFRRRVTVQTLPHNTQYWIWNANNQSSEMTIKLTFYSGRNVRNCSSGAPARKPKRSAICRPHGYTYLCCVMHGCSSGAPAPEAKKVGHLPTARLYIALLRYAWL